MSAVTLVFILAFASYMRLPTFSFAKVRNAVLDSESKPPKLGSLRGNNSPPYICEIFRAEPEKNRSAEKVLDGVITLLTLPIVDNSGLPTASEMPPPLDAKSLNCELKEKKIVDIFLFAPHDVDTLEMRLVELYDVVDEFVVIEGDYDHRGRQWRTVVKDLLRTQRFAPFKDKVRVEVIAERPATEEAVVPEGEISWSFEHFRTEKMIGIAKNYEENTATIVGHADTIPNRESVWRLKMCDVKLPANFGTWFPFGNLKTIYYGDWPVKRGDFRHVGPNVNWAKDAFYSLRRTHPIERTTVLPVIGGGFHATWYPLPQYAILKQLTATEYRSGEGWVEAVRNTILEKGCTAGVEEIMANVKNSMEQCKPKHKVRAVTKKDDVSAPWALRTQPDRYPAWYGKSDPRTWYSASAIKSIASASRS